MRFETLREFIIVAKHLNITKAAQELYLSQPSLSARIAALEKELGYLLFDRSQNKLALTPAGSVLLEYAQRIADLHDEALEKAQAAARRVPTVKVATIEPSSVYYGMLPRNEACPFSFVDLDINTSAIDALLKGTIDVAIDSDDSAIDELREEGERLGIAFFRIGMASASLSVMAHHPLAGKARLARNDLEGQTIVINSGTHFDRWSRMVRWMLGEDVKTGFRMNPLDTMSNLSFTDFGDSLYICGSESCRPRLAQRSDVVLFDEIDGEQLLYPVALLCRAQDVQDPEGPTARFVERFLGA